MTEQFRVNAGKCNSCVGQIDDNEVMTCFRCKENFHAVCNGSNVICNKSLLALYHQRSTKRNFVWYCDCCLTQLELVTTESQSSLSPKVRDIENKLDLLTAKVSSITDILAPSSTTALPQGNSHFSNSVWQNTSRITILKNSLSGSPDLEQLEKRIVDGHIAITNSKRNHKGDVIITCPTSAAANKVKELANEVLPDHTVNDPLVKYSWINVVGFETNHSSDAIFDLLIANNSAFESLKGKTQEDVAEYLAVKVVKPCLKNPSVYRALIKVSKSLREVIKLGKDKLRIGLYLCTVYDQAPQIRRCNKCQKYGHWVAECNLENGQACAKCASTLHETRNCPNPSQSKCINCIRAGIVNHHQPHAADSSACPCFVEYRKTSYASNGNTDLSQNNRNRMPLRPAPSAHQFYSNNSTPAPGLSHGVPAQTFSMIPHQSENVHGNNFSTRIQPSIVQGTGTGHIPHHSGNIHGNNFSASVQPAIVQGTSGGHLNY